MSKKTISSNFLQLMEDMDIPDYEFTWEKLLEIYTHGYYTGYTDGYKVGVCVGKYSKWLEAHDDYYPMDNTRNRNCHSCKYDKLYDELHLPCCLCRAGSQWESADEEQD